MLENEQEMEENLRVYGQRGLPEGSACAKVYLSGGNVHKEIWRKVIGAKRTARAKTWSGIRLVCSRCRKDIYLFEVETVRGRVIGSDVNQVVKNWINGALKATIQHLD